MRTSLAMLAILCASTWAFGGNVIAPYSGIGNCPGAQFVTGLNAHAPPTCAAGGGGVGVGVQNGVINVKDPAFNAKGDGSADDTAAIQTAVTSACAAASTPRPPIYFPPTQYPTFYKVTKPILINCNNLTLVGGGEFQSEVQSIGYYGPVFLLQQNFNSWTQPFIGNIGAAWAAGHAYSTNAELKDSNGNIELTTTGGTSGGTVPSWCTTQGCTTSDNSVTWTLENIGTKWNGNNVFDTLGSTAILGGRNQNVLDLSSVSTPAAINGLSAMTVEVELNAFSVPTFYNPILMSAGLLNSQPYNGQQSGGSTGQWDAFGVTFSQTPDARCEFAISGTVTTLTFTRPSFNNYHHIACVFTGSAITAYVDGTQAATTSVSGTISATVNDKIWFMGNGNGTQNGLPSYVAWARISNNARYTSNFTVPTAVPANDSNTLYLLGFPTAPAVGIVQAVGNGLPLYLPYSLGANGGSPMTTITNMTIQAQGGPAIWADWSYDSHFDHLSINSVDTDNVVLFNTNDFQGSMDHSFIQGFNAVHGTQQLIGLNFGSQNAGFEVSDVQFDGIGLTTAVQGPTTGTLRGVRVTDRGYLTYTFASAGNDTYDTDFIDSEGGNIEGQCNLYLNNPYAPTIVTGGELDLNTSASGAAYICQNGGQSVSVNGTYFGGAGVAELLNVISAPSQAVVVRDAKFPAIARTNAANGQYLSIQQNGTPEQVTNANLWSCGAIDLGAQVLVTDNDSACSFGGTPSHSSCTIGTNCFACVAKCQVSGATVYAWKE